MPKKRHGNGSAVALLNARAEEIIQNGMILDIGSARYRVSSQSVIHTYYDVTYGANGWRCSCPYHINGHRRCKHVRAVAGLVMKERRLMDDGIERVLTKEPEAACRFCRSADCRGCEVRKNKGWKVRRYRCRSCKRRFTHNPGFVGRHFPPHVITDALQDCASGPSPAKVVEGMAKNGIKVSESTICRWISDYGEIIERFHKKARMPVGYTWHVDEIHFKSRGESMWLFGVMDAETGQIIAYGFSGTKFGYDATDLFRDAVEIAGGRPDIIITDGLKGFGKAYRRVMYTNTKPRPYHITDVGIQDRHAVNNVYERFNGEIKDRIARIRGFSSKDPALLRLLIVYHNFMRPHGGLGGRTPAEAAGVAIDGPDKWLTLIRHAATFCA